MSCTQVQIAEALRLDVSTVNKILNRRQGPVFKKETIAKVNKAARRMGYDFSRASKGKLVQTLAELFPLKAGDGILSITRGVPIEKVQEIKQLIRRSCG